MGPETLLVQPRVRQPQESLDLGMQLARRWWWPLTLMAAVPTTGIALLAGWATESVWLAWLLAWWLKPACERLPLWYLSRAVFDEAPDARTLIRVAPRVIGTQLLATLLWRRLAAARSFDQPVAVLEGLRGRDRARRLAVLHGQGAGTAGLWLTVVGVHVEMIVQLSLFALLAFVLPEAAGEDFWSLLDHPLAQWVGWWLGTVLVMPFYVAGGFALYLGRRMTLEGWDLELVFREWAARLPPARPEHGLSTGFAGSGRGVAGGLGLGLLLGLVLLAPIPPSWADSGEVSPRNPEEARASVRQVLQGPDFERLESQRVPAFLKEWWEPQAGVAEAVWPEWVAWAERLASVFEGLVWIALGTLGVLLILRYRRALSLLWSEPRQSREVAADSPLPASVRALAPIVAQAGTRDRIQALWQAGCHREALAALYVSALRPVLPHVRLPPGATEQDCLQLARGLAPEGLLDTLREVTTVWLPVAYGGRLPDGETFERLLEACHPIALSGRDHD